MQASFIIPLYNCLALTRECLRTLRSTLPAGLDHEIIFVDDGSTDGTREWLGSLSAPCRAILNEKNLGFAGACNRGAAAANGDFHFFLNNDLVFLPGWFEPMLAVFDRRSDAALVGNVQLNATTGAVDHAGIFFNHQGKPQHVTAASAWSRRRPFGGIRAVAALTGACFAVRRDRWRQLGGFDEGFVNGGEDIDLCLRARAKGRRNYVALRSVVRHHVSASPGRKRHDERNTFRLVERWRSQIAVLAARDWSRHFIAAYWDQSGAYDAALGRHSLYCWLGASPGPDSPVLLGVHRAIEDEVIRWQKMFPSPPRSAQV